MKLIFKEISEPAFATVKWHNEETGRTHTDTMPPFALDKRALALWQAVQAAARNDDAPTKRPITREQHIERFRKTQADAKAVGLDFSEHDPVHMSDSDMIRIGTQIKEAIEIERSVTKEPA